LANLPQLLPSGLCRSVGPAISKPLDGAIHAKHWRSNAGGSFDPFRYAHKNGIQLLLKLLNVGYRPCGRGLSRCLAVATFGIETELPFGRATD